MDLDFLIFPAPRSTYDKNTFREVIILLKISFFNDKIINI